MFYTCLSVILFKRVYPSMNWAGGVSQHAIGQGGCMPRGLGCGGVVYLLVRVRCTPYWADTHYADTTWAVNPLPIGRDPPGRHPPGSHPSGQTPPGKQPPTPR